MRPHQGERLTKMTNLPMRLRVASVYLSAIPETVQQVAHITEVLASRDTISHHMGFGEMLNTNFLHVMKKCTFFNPGFLAERIFR